MTVRECTAVGDLVGLASQRFGGKVAIICEGQTWTFEQVNDAASRVAQYLQNSGVVAGDRVSLYSPNCPEWIAGYYGILKLGAVVNPLNLMLSAEEAAYAIRDCGASAVLGAGELVERLLPVMGETALKVVVSLSGNTPEGAVAFTDILACEPLAKPYVSLEGEELCTIGYTSGTTGFPKGAMLSHKAILVNVRMTSTMHVRTSQDTALSALPCSHVYGNIVMNSAFLCGMTLVLHKTFDVTAVLQSIQEHRVTLFEGVPTMYHYLMSSGMVSGFDISSLTRCTIGGQSISAERLEQIERLMGCPILELWGMTELGGLGTTHSAYGPKRYGSIGVPLPHLEARIISTDDRAKPMPSGEIGELQIRGPVTMTGYFGKQSQTQETLSEEGWLSTGDLAYADAEGFLYIVDRLKDLIITGGFNIYPAELERVIGEYPGVAMVAVAGVPDDLKGELAKAFIVQSPDVSIDIDLLEQYCRMRLAAYKVPRAFQFVDALPTTSTGKVLRRELRKLA